MDTKVVRTLLRVEILMLLRDRRTVVLSIVLPLLMMPLLMFGSYIMEEKRKQRLESAEHTFALAGPEIAFARPRIEATRRRLERERGQDKTTLVLRERTIADPEAALRSEEIDFFIEASRAPQGVAVPPAGPPVTDPNESKRRDDRDAPEKPQPGVSILTVVYRGDLDRSARVADRVSAALAKTRREEQAGLLAAHGFPLPAQNLAKVVVTNLATAGQVAGLTLGRMITLMLLLFVLTGGSVVATDTLAGEKERGTLETLLTTAAGRNEIVTAKLLAILAVASSVTLIQVANFLIYVGFKIIPVSAGFAAAVSPQVALLLLVLFLPMAALASAVLLLVSGYARSYKEAQLYFFPVVLLGTLPALAPFLPGLRLRSAIALVPVSNVAVAVKEILTGTFDWPMIALASAVNLAAAVWASRLAARALSAERLISPAATDSIELQGGPALFPRHVLRVFAVVWAVLLIVAVNTEKLDVRLQLLINLPVLFGGATGLMLRRYRLDPRQALALRPVNPAVWLAVLLGAPAGLLTGVGVFKLASLIVPVPPEMLQSFGRALVPPHIPLWHIVLFLCVLPAVFEELLFRGLLLHGLTRRMRPLPAVLVNGAMFGLIHVSLFRLAPTAYLGMLFAAATLLTGSIFPAMLWHFLNNLQGLVLPKLGLDLPQLGPELGLVGAVTLGVCFWILWRCRMPDLELRSRGARLNR